jgi:hypothetical protein
MAFTYQPYQDERLQDRLPYRVGQRVGQASEAVSDLADRTRQSALAASRAAIAAAMAPVNAARTVASDFSAGLAATKPQPTPTAKAFTGSFTGPGIPEQPGVSLVVPKAGMQPAQTQDQPKLLSPEQQLAVVLAGPPGLTQGPPVYTTSPTSGTLTSSRGTQTVPNNYGAASVNTYSALEALPRAQFGSGQYGMAQPSAGGVRSAASDVTRDRSSQMDRAVAELVKRVQAPLNSYGDLFQRKGALAALNAMSGLAQGAGSNYVAATGDQLSANVQTRGQDIGSQTAVMQNATQRRGQDLTYNAAVAGQQQRQADAVERSKLEREKQDRADRRAALNLKTQQDITKAQIDAADWRATFNAALKNPLYKQELETIIATGRKADGSVATKAEQEEAAKRYAILAQPASSFLGVLP